MEQKALKRDEKGRLMKGTPPGPGRPINSENFSTKWYRMIDKIAANNSLTPDEIERDLLNVGYNKAKGGDYSFYRDAMDRIHGKPKESIDHNHAGGLSILFDKTFGEKENE